MKLHIEWRRPIRLRDGRKQGWIYTVDLAKLPSAPGIYVLGRRWGSQFEAIYVGKANKIRGRLKGQLNNLRLMHHLKGATGGKRVVLAGTIVTRPGQRLQKSLLLIERALIRYFLSEGHDLVNKQGTRLRRHQVLSSGKHPRRFIPNPLYLERGKRE
jgi:hypothetical protein